MFIPYLLAFNLLKTYLENRISIFVNILFLCYHAAEMLLLVFLSDSASSEVSKKIQFITAEFTVEIKMTIKLVIIIMMNNWRFRK